MSEIDKLHTRIRELEDELASVRAEAVEDVEFWGQFASKYSQAHHDLQGDIERLKGKRPVVGDQRAVLGSHEPSQNGSMMKQV